tara:strand:+ start:3788 stop:5776 length:1989 start_codon:yes stop_codon:yes gene_type:complete
MGGVAGHMDHLYDRPDLTFGKMKEIMSAASNGKLTTEEKVDGQNLFLSYSIAEGKAKGARNKGNLKAGGLDAVTLAQKFAGRGGLAEAFNGGFSAFETAVESLSTDEKQNIFGPDANIWYNSEVMDPGAANVIKYDSKTLKIHGVGHFVFDRETGEKQPIPKGALETLDAALKRMQEALSGHDFSLVRRAIIQLEKLEDDKILNIAKAQIDSAIGSESLSDNSTVQDYVFSRLMKGIDTDLPEKFKEEVVKYILGLPGNIGLKALKKGLPNEDLQDLGEVMASKKMLLKESIYPIEIIVHDFTVGILKSLKSVFIADTDKEVERLKIELSTAVKEISNSGAEDPQSMQIMQRQLNKIKDFSQITTPIEAVVFDYDGHTYKFAGNFAPLNQILGMFKYPKVPRKLATESLSVNSTVLTEEEGKRIALIPGGFKPPHAGHFMLAKHFANKEGVDEVRVIVSTKPRPPVTVNMAIKLWELYTKDFPKIKVQAGSTPSPVGDVYELIADNSVFKEGDIALLGKSEKDADDTRFDRAQSYAERHNPGVSVEPIVTPLFAGGVSGTQMRNLLVQGEKGKDEFKANLPRHLSADEKEAAYNILVGSNENLDRLIDSTIEEISSMGAGAVEGGMGNFGAPNSYDAYGKSRKSRTKTKKPSVIKAKRQRRR